MKISELQPRQGKVELTAVVIEVGEPRAFNKFGKEGKVANATIKDDGGQMVLTLWNEQVDQVAVGDTVTISNGYVGEWQGEMQLSTGKYGKLEVTKGTAAPTPAAPTEPKPDMEEEKLGE
jgi:replication factor A1